MSQNVDFLLDENGDIPLNAELQSGDLVTLQMVDRRLKTFRGEWIIDGSEGLPYIEWRSQKPPDVQGMGAEVLNEILTTPCVNTVVDFSSTFDFEAQQVNISGTVVLDSGTSADFEFTPKLGANSLPYVAILYPSLRVVP